MIELIILGMLYNGQPLTSYTLKKHMGQSTEFFQSNSLGSIQPGLKKLEKLGYLTSENVVEGGRKKTNYLITEAGQQYFESELRKDFGPDKIKCNQLVKMFFFNRLNHTERMESTDLYIDEVRRVKRELLTIKSNAERAIAALTAGDLRAYDCGEDIMKQVHFEMDTLRFGLDYYTFLDAWFTDYKCVLKKRELDQI